jgi:spore coat protein CotH
VLCIIYRHNVNEYLSVRQRAVAPSVVKRHYIPNTIGFKNYKSGKKARRMTERHVYKYARIVRSALVFNILGQPE